MNPEQKALMDLGAELVAGDLYLNRTLVGQHRNGQFLITPEGAGVLAGGSRGAVVTPLGAAAQPKVLRGRRKASEPLPVHEPEPEVTVDGLVGDLDAELQGQMGE